MRAAGALALLASVCFDNNALERHQTTLSISISYNYEVKNNKAL